MLGSNTHPSFSTISVLITAAESVSSAEQPGGAVVERLAALTFGADSASVPPFGVVAPTADGLLLLLRGAVIANIDDGERSREMLELLHDIQSVCGLITVDVRRNDAERTPSARKSRMRMDCPTLSATFGSGPPIGMATTAVPPRKIQLAPEPVRVV